MLKIDKIKKVHGDYEGLSFVLGAKTKDDTRKNLDCILWDGSCYWATDGYRLHYYYAIDNSAEVGVYKLVSKDKNTIVLDKDNGIKYPDITCLTLFKNKGPQWELDINTNNDNLSIPYSKIIRNMEPEKTINFDYFKALPPDHYTVYSHGTKDCICFANSNKGAAIMPMRVE
jgi:hypothetical protein